MLRVLLALATAATAVPSVSAPLCADLGFSGLLAACNRGEPIAVTLASGQPLGTDVVLQSGAYYEMEITADGSAEVALSGAGFFRAIWINEIVIEDIEVRPMAIDSLEFDDAGTARMSFIAIVPGSYVLSIPGTTGDTQKFTITIQ